MRFFFFTLRLLISNCLGIYLYFHFVAITSSDLDEGLKAKGSLYLRNRDADGKQLLVFDVKKHFKGTANMDDMQKMFIYFLERVDREGKPSRLTSIESS